jgi:serine/threonine-protein kinase
MSAPDLAPPASIPERIGRYEILLPIGTGGMATVYLARAEVMSGFHRDFALKMMHPQIHADGGSAAAQLIDEAKLTASIRHPNVVAVHEAADSPRGVYMVMDYVEGDSLSGLIRAARAAGTTLPLPIIGRILTDALAGLHAAHELRGPSGEPLNLVHRDYSPSNILVGVDGVTRLADFGIAKVEGRAGGTATGAIKGKIGYMAPEQVRGQKLDRRCDVWAAGVVAWECLAGQRMLTGDDPIATLLRIAQEEPPLLAVARPDLPDELGAAIASALTRDREHRCPTAAELRKRLIAAWGALGAIADTAEVGELVARLVGDRLEKQRRKVAQVLELRGQLADLSRAALAAAPTPSYPLGAPANHPADRPRAIPDDRRATLPETVAATSSEVTLAGAEDAITARAVPAPRPAAPSMSTADTVPVARPAPRRARWIGPAAIGAIALAGSGAWVLGASHGRDVTGAAASATAPSAASTGSAVATTVGSQAPSGDPPAASAASSSAPAARSVLVRANAAIASLVVGQRAIAMAQASREVEVRLTEAESSGPLRIDATSTDGRRASAQLAADAASVDLVFNVARSAPAAKAGDEPPRLAPSPFGKR